MAESDPPPYAKNEAPVPYSQVAPQGPTPGIPQAMYQHPISPDQVHIIQSQPMQHSASTTVVVVNQPQPQQQTLRSWSTGICGCCEDPKICLLVTFCTECYACHLASKAGETCCLPCCVPGWMTSLRAHIRGKHGIAGSITEDCCVVSYCYPCTMCQLSRELDNINKGAVPR